MDDTAPLPPPPPPYRPYGASAGGPPPGPPPLGAPGQPGGPGRSTPAPANRGGRRGVFAGSVIAASLLVGAGAGVGGAAAYSYWDDDSSTTPTANAGVTSSVVDAPKTAVVDGSIESVAQKVLPSVVEIDVSGSAGAGSGSGIVLSSTGQILTNNHVVEVAGTGGTINVSFQDGTNTSATILGTDPLTDTALIQAKNVSGLTPATIGKSGNLSVGQAVVAVGSPFGLESTVTSGIVSALDRPVDVGATEDSDSDSRNTTTYPAIQTDAAINPGNSGGALADLNGNVVGINASIRTAEGTTEDQSGSIGLGFAIPMDEVIPIVQQMAAGQTPTHARLGIHVGNVGQTDGNGNPFLGGDAGQGGVVEGAKVATVDDGSTAGKAGLKADDVVTKVDDRLIVSADSLVATIRSYRPGDQVTLTYVRGGETKTAQLTLDSDGGATSE